MTRFSNKSPFEIHTAIWYNAVWHNLKKVEFDQIPAIKQRGIDKLLAIDFIASYGWDIPQILYLLVNCILIYEIPIKYCHCKIFSCNVNYFSFFVDLNISTVTILPTNSSTLYLSCSNGSDCNVRQTDNRVTVEYTINHHLLRKQYPIKLY